MKHKQIRLIKYSSTFLKAFRKFPRSQLKALSVKEKIFRDNCFNPRLKTHKLKGELSDFYSFSISYHFRIVFHFEEEDVVVFDTIGTHAVYR